jgi:TusA-related sulfurtransferase
MYEAAGRLATLADGEVLELLTDPDVALDNDIHAWCRTTGHQLVGVNHGDRENGMSSASRRCRRPGVGWRR